MISTLCTQFFDVIALWCWLAGIHFILLCVCVFFCSKFRRVQKAPKGNGSEIFVAIIASDKFPLFLARTQSMHEHLCSCTNSNELMLLTSCIKNHWILHLIYVNALERLKQGKIQQPEIKKYGKYSFRNCVGGGVPL